MNIYSKHSGATLPLARVSKFAQNNERMNCRLPANSPQMYLLYQVSVDLFQGKVCACLVITRSKRGIMGVSSTKGVSSWHLGKMFRRTVASASAERKNVTEMSAWLSQMRSHFWVCFCCAHVRFGAWLVGFPFECHLQCLYLVLHHYS